MKYLVILLLFLSVAGYIYWRLRPYIKSVRRAFGVLRDFQRVSRGETPADLPRRQPAKASAEKLLRCAACGTWTPASRVVNLPHSRTVYCSTDCLERSADAPRRVNKSAS